MTSQEEEKQAYRKTTSYKDNLHEGNRKVRQPRIERRPCMKGKYCHNLD